MILSRFSTSHQQYGLVCIIVGVYSFSVLLVVVVGAVVVIDVIILRAKKLSVT